MVVITLHSLFGIFIHLQSEYETCLVLKSFPSLPKVLELFSLPFTKKFGNLQIICVCNIAFNTLFFNSLSSKYQRVLILVLVLMVLTVLNFRV